MAGSRVPADFVAWLEATEPRLRAACLDLTGNARTAETLRRDLLAAVALRWRWWRVAGGRRSRLASAYLSRLLRLSLIHI